MNHYRSLALTRDFGRDVALLNAFNQRRLGLRAVPVAAISGSVGRTDLGDPARLAAWKRTGRYRAILQALDTGMCLPPVDLYLLDGQYYIRDGHHRVVAACQLGILDVDAEVTECLPRPDTTAAAWHRARAAFERDTGLLGLHIRRADGYEWLRRQIAEHAWYLGEQGRAPAAFAEAAARWEHDVYQSVVAILTRRRVIKDFPELTTAELYLAVCDHKWYRGERLARDIGFAAAVRQVARARRHPGLTWLARWLEGGWVTLVRYLTRYTLSLTLAA